VAHTINNLIIILKCEQQKTVNCQNLNGTSLVLFLQNCLHILRSLTACDMKDCSYKCYFENDNNHSCLL